MTTVAARRPALPASRTPLFSRFLCRFFFTLFRPPQTHLLAVVLNHPHWLHSQHCTQHFTQHTSKRAVDPCRVRDDDNDLLCSCCSGIAGCALFSWPLTLVLRICAARRVRASLLLHFGEYPTTALEPRESKRSGTAFCTVSRIRHRIGIGILPLTVTPRCATNRPMKNL